jgi:dTDP-4-dehydrorhamnose reductase
MKKPKILIIGARGFLGSYAVEAASSKADVARGDRSNPESDGVAIDIRDASSVDKAFAATRPDGILLLAAMADIDKCEAQPGEAFAINVQGAEHVARACARSGARLVFASTGAVFDGLKQGYGEDDDVSPISVYGKTKVEAEEIVRALTPSAAIVRLSLVIGWARRHGTNSMLNTLRERWQEDNAVSFPVAEVRNPVHAASAAEAMASLLVEHRETRGVFHAGSSDAISRYELGRRLAERMNVRDDLVKPQTEISPGRAPRGAHHFLLPWKLQKLLGTKAQSSEQVIEGCFA